MGQSAGGQGGASAPGSTTIGNLDYASIERIDGGVAEAYVREAVAKYDEFKASNAKAGKK